MYPGVRRLVRVSLDVTPFIVIDVAITPDKEYYTYTDTLVQLGTKAAEDCMEKQSL
jgi:hypothetical protein